MIISEASLADGQLSDFVLRLRNGEISVNPFLSIIGIFPGQDRKAFAELEASGVDDILEHPISTLHLVECISKVVSKKPQFLVTGNYFGPVRRSAIPPDGIGAEPISVPHTLKG
jgi:hypothetical protein